MPEYTFHMLSDADFEDLTCDLLGADRKLRFQSFTRGADQGIDLLHGSRICHSTVVQCKHYWGSGFSKLKASIKSKELPKLARLKPKRYILSTSVGLTPRNKEDLLGLLSPHCHGLEDIYGCHDLNMLLRKHPDVEIAHHKLWLTSTPVLQRVLRQGKAVWSALTKSEIERKMCLYVKTSAYEAALGILDKHNYCVISGIPGVGKTTLAQILVTRLIDDDFELIAIRDDVGEALELLDLNRRQIVYYDDFLGRSCIGDRLGKNEDRGILRLLGEASRSSVLKVVLTTREYILNEARRQYEPLSGPELDIAKCIVKVEDYTRGHRARILYNHVFFSDLPHEYAVCLARERAYRAIVDHKNYSPRIIEWMTSETIARARPAEEFVAEFVKALDDPLRIWAHAFDNQIGDDARALLFCLATVAQHMEMDALRTSWAALIERGARPNVRRELRERFIAALKHLDGSFIRTERGHTATGVSFHNPSIRDFVAHRIATDGPLRQDLLESSQFFEQVACLVRLNGDGHIQAGASGLVGDSRSLRDAARRTFAAAPGTLCLVTFGSGSTPKLGFLLTDLGQRLTLMAKWTGVLGVPWLSLVCDIAKEQAGSQLFANVATTGACGFVEAVVHQWPPLGGDSSPVVRQYIAEIGNHMDETASAESWATWSHFVQENSGLFTTEELDECANEAVRFCAAEIDVIIENAKSEPDAEAWLETVEEVAIAWGFSIEEEDRDRVESRIAEMSAGSDDASWEGGWSSGQTAPEPSGSDHELDALFDSLADREDRQTG